MNLQEARYILEHKLFPEWFFNDKIQFVGALADSKANTAYDLMSRICKKKNIECTYKPEQYKSELFKIDNGNFLLLKLTFPKPENTPLCYRAYMIFNEDFTKASYFTAEKSFENKLFLCGWDKKRTHLNYGEFSGDEQQEMKKAVELHISRFAKDDTQN